MPTYARTLLVLGPPDEVREASKLHREHLADLRRRGKLVLAGEFKNGEGFLEIFEAADLREAQAVAESSPLVARGLGTWMLREWSALRFDG
jgi:uncharacterized protein YciI